jgi:hypothetical protein
METEKAKKYDLNDLLTEGVIDTTVNKTGLLMSAEESKKLVNVPKLLQTKSISEKLRKKK